MKAGKFIFGLLLTAAAVTGGYLLYKRLKGGKSTPIFGGSDTGSSTTATTSGSSTTSGSVTSGSQAGFPLAFGSRGQLVKDIQNALMVLYPNSLPKYGADGIWGKETEAALKSNNLPTTINKPDYDRLIAAAKSGKPISTSTSQGGVLGWYI